MIQIKCDLDGVLVNMDEYIKQHLSPEAADNKELLWQELAMDSRFYQKMNPTPYAKRLWSAITALDPEATILSALPRKSTIPYADVDKRQWVHDHRRSVFGGRAPVVETCLYSANKWKHCMAPKQILIDDKRSNCEDWIRAGGIAIHHTGSATRTIKLLHDAIRIHKL